jgi:acetylornithine deacetylase/succinyl-diaminopimelate desuccinylase-like protein
LVALGLIGAGATCTPHTAPVAFPYPDRQTWADRVDWTAARDEAARTLSEYVQVNTANPPGNEAAGAAFLTDLFTREGIETTSWEFAPGRTNLVARLRADKPAEAPLCLLSHIDVVTAEPERWTHPPFSGLIDEQGTIWGRGTMDMKGIGVIEALSLVWLKRLGVPLRRDVIVLAVGDEEVDNLGAQDLADHHWQEIGCSQLLNEGGLGVKGALFDDLTTFAVSFTEKGALWARMVATGEPGHGSTPLPDSAPARLTQALERLRARDPKVDIHPELQKFLGAIGDKVGGITGAVLKSPWATRELAGPKLLANPLSAATVTNTINVTGFGGAEKPNVVPSKVWAQLDIRMLPGVTSQDMLGELGELVEGIDGISFEVLSDSPAVESTTDDPLFRALLNHLQVAYPDAAVGPFVMMGSTDSTVLRPLGVRAYGFAPFVFTQDELKGFHGDDERISSDNLVAGLKVLFGVVLETSASGGVSSAAATE